MSQYENIFVTGTTGRVGRAIMPGLRHAFSVSEFDLHTPNPDNLATFRGDICDIDPLAAAVEKVRPSCIVHLAANADHTAPEGAIYEPNIVGLGNIYQVARRHGVRKLVCQLHSHPERLPWLPLPLTFRKWPAAAAERPHQPGQSVRRK